MQSRRSIFRIVMFAVILLAGCATSYGPSGLTGGYKEEKLDEHTFAIYFFGNGHTSGDTVWNYWIYRCAESTKEKGFTSFTLSPLDKKTSALGLPFHYSNHGAADEAEPRFVKVKGGAAPTYYYVPGQQITTYSAKAIVTMYSQPYPAKVGFLLDPDKIISALKPYVESGGKTVAPVRREIMEKALIAPSTPI